MNSFGFVTLLIYLFCFLWRPQDYILAIYALPILFFLQILTLCFWIISRKDFNAPQYKYLLGLLFALGVSSVLSLGVRNGVDKAWEFLLLQCLTFVLVANALTTVSRQRQFYAVFLMGTIIMALHTVDQVLDPDRIGWTGVQMLRRTDAAEQGLEVWQPRYVGIFNDPNDLGLMLVASVPMVFYFYFSTTNKLVKVLMVGCLALQLSAIWLTNSRGTLLGVIAMLGIWGILRYGGFKLLLRYILLSPLVPLIVPSRFYISGDDSADGRISAWYEGTQMFLSNPFFGVGKDNFLDYHTLTAHNSWVLIFAELGYVGYYFWVALIFTSMYFAWMCQRDFSETGLPQHLQKAYESEALLAKALMYSMIGTMACAFFISRSYISILYILPAIAVAQYQRFQHQFKQIQFKPQAKNMLWISMGFFLLINMIVRINT